MLDSLKTGRLEDGNRSIADKIIKRLGELEKTVEKNRGRWAWELLQNAKDSVSAFDEKRVAVKIEYDQNSLKFSHNGIHFTELDLRGIINQISSKEVAEEEHSRNTGRFGTGFLTTHLLSRKVKIVGILKSNDDNKYYPFELLLDRTAKQTSEFIKNLEETWTSIERSKLALENYDTAKFSTSFSYELLTDSQHEVAEVGLQEFVKMLPLVLAFIPKIESVEIIDSAKNKRTRFENTGRKFLNKIVSIKKIEGDYSSDIFILTNSNDEITIATILEKTEQGYAIQPIDDFPKLFCDFPLVGTEKFHFPFIVNSFNFNPLTERDGLWLKDDKHKEVQENQQLIEQTVALIKDLLQYLEEGNFYQLYNVAETRIPNADQNTFDANWFEEKITTPIRDTIFNASIVEMEGSTERKALKDTWFPRKDYTKNEQVNIWKYLFDLFPGVSCKKDHLHYWSRLSWENWNIEKYETLLDDIAKFENITKLSKHINKSEYETFDWLNEVCKFVLEDESNTIVFEKKAIVPNRNGVFTKRGDLKIDKIKDDELIEILAALGVDWKNILLHPNISFGRYEFIEKKDISTEITKILLRRNQDDDYKDAIVMLMEWFDHNHPDDATILFSDLYRKKADLFMGTMGDKESLYRVMRSKTDLGQIAKLAEIVSKNPTAFEDTTKLVNIANLLTEFGLMDVDNLRKRLQNLTNEDKIYQKQDITKEFLAGAGITSLEDLEAALKDKNLSDFVHRSIPDFNMLQYVKRIIERAKQNIINHLNTLPNYDCSNIEELTPNTFGGITRDGVQIIVVIRPSDNGFVIVYSNSEKDYLDYEDANAELWIENGVDKPRHLRLGKVIKNLGINKIPV